MINVKLAHFIAKTKKIHLSILVFYSFKHFSNWYFFLENQHMQTIQFKDSSQK